MRSLRPSGGGDPYLWVRRWHFFAGGMFLCRSAGTLGRDRNPPEADKCGSYGAALPAGLGARMMKGGAATAHGQRFQTRVFS